MARKKNKDSIKVVKKISNPDYIIYTDGGCAVNPGGPGGTGTLIFNCATKECTEIYKGYKTTTNNRMEIRAIIDGLEVIPKGSSAQVHSDSQYAIYCMAGMWKKKKNMDLWTILDGAAEGKRLGLTWIKGHNGNSYNERCDTLATMGINTDEKIDDIGYTEERPNAGGQAQAAKRFTKTEEGAMGVDIVIPEELCEEECILTSEEYTEKYGVTDMCAASIIKFKKSRRRNFSAYMGLKTGGLDEHSLKSAGVLADKKGENAELYLGTIRKYIPNEKDVNVAARWNARGLSLYDSIRKALVDAELREKGKWE